MKKGSKLLIIALTALFSVTGFFGCTKSPSAATAFNGVDFEGDSFISLIGESGSQTLNTAVMFDSDAYITYGATGDFNAANGTTYKRNTENPMLKPVWEELGKRLSITFVNKSGGANNLQGQWDAAYGASFSGYDVLNASVENINTQGELYSSFVNLKPFLKRMPNLKAFLNDNPFAANTILSGSGKMYYAPYFDGYDDIERMFIMRADWVQKLLDGSVAGDSAAVSGLNVYTPFLPASLPAQTVAVTAKSGITAEQLNKLATTNIISRMNALTNPTGNDLINTFRAYITERYGNYYGDTPSDLFVGQNAAYDADELVALLRLVKANPKLVTGISTMTSANIVPFYPRSYTNDRTADIMRLAQIWGIRGLDTPNGYLFIDSEGNLQDARTMDDSYYGVQKLNELYQEGLILNDFNNSGTLGTLSPIFNDREFRGHLNRTNRGFMTYDYNQTTTLLNGLDGESSAVGPTATTAQIIEGFELTPVLPPFTVWKGKTYNTDKALSLPATLSADNFYRFTESWRSVKPDGWCIPSSVTGKKLERALALFDYMYTAEGSKLMSFGPDEWIATSNENASGGAGSEANGTISYMGRDIPRLATQALSELKNYADGNYTNYYRRYLGGAMPLGYVKDQGMEYQMTHTKGKAGQDKINNAVLTGTLKHALVGSDYYTSTDLSMRIAPTTLPFTKQEQSVVTQNYDKLTRAFDISNVTGNAGENLFYRYIKGGFGTATSGDPKAVKLTHAALLDYVSKSGGDNLNCNGFLTVCQGAYKRIPKP